MRPRLAPLALVALLLGCEPCADPLDFERQEAPVFRARELKPPADPEPSVLKVMTWNIKFGGGRIDFWFDHWGDAVRMTEAQVDGNLEGIYELLREYEPDVLLVEEIDVNSARSAYRDMVRGILENTSLNYASYHQTWDSRHVPSEGLGRVDMGNAIFSRYPIEYAETIRQADRTDQDALTEEFYLHRAVGRAEIRAGSRRIAAYVVHTEAYDEDGTKRAHLAQIHELVGLEPLPFVLGGDFNELPPNALQLTDFPDERASAEGGEFDQPPYHPEDMQPFFDELVPAIALERIGDTPDSQLRFFTHSVLSDRMTNDEGVPGFWNRTLDYLFVRAPGSWVEGSSDVLQEPGRMGIRSKPMDLSDHAPVVGTWEIGE